MTWETEAENWIAWTRAQRHDAYWYYRDWFFEWMVPPPGRATLDLGCGEGRVGRDLRERGHSVTGVDSAPTLVRAAKEADPDGTYLVAEAATLPLDDESFDLVVAHNSLMDIEDMAGAVRETARVLEPGGRLCASVTHPILDAGAFESNEPEAPFRLTENYRERRRFEGTFERAGLQITFRGWCHPLEAYLRAFEGAALLLERLREPGDPGEDPRHARLPLFLYLRALKPA